MTQSTSLVDEFSGDDFAPERAPLPYLQILNNQAQEQSGLFISAENAAAVGFSPNDEWQPHEAHFLSGQSASGLRTLTARIIILRKSPLMMFNRSTKQFLGIFDRESYNPAIMLLKTRHLVYLVTKQKQLFHDTPLQLTTKGSFCGSFGQHYNQFRGEISRAYGQPRGDRFHALSIFAIRLQPVLKGKEKKSWVCSIQDHGMPTKSNWKAFFVGYDPDIKKKLLTEFEEYRDFGNIQNSAQEPDAWPDEF